MRKTLLALGVSATVVGCGAAPEVDVGGGWDITESFSSQSGISCDMTGELLLAHQMGSSIFGGLATRNATCTGAPNDFNPGGADEVTNSNVSGSDVRFTIDFCDYDGTVSSGEMSGTIACELGVSGQATQFTGTWQASRQ